VTRRRRAHHAAARARKLTAALSILAFVGIGQTINSASQVSTTPTQTASANLVVASPHPSAATRPATVSAVAATTPRGVTNRAG
jgi:hypothetical protein